MILFVDLDGTLSDDRWRRDAIPDWDAYHAGIPNDSPRETVAQFLLLTSHCFDQVVILTGRPARFRGETIEWMKANSIPYDDILMRPNDDFSSNADVKLVLARECLREHALRDCEAIFIDNNQKVADLLRTEGFEVWLVE